MRRQSTIQNYLVNLNNYKVIEQIGQGGFATVVLVEDKKTHERYAAKVNSPYRSTDEIIKYISREIAILVRVQAPTIVHFFGFSLQDFNQYANITILMV